MNLKSNLKLYLASKSMTAAELSRITKVPKATISDWLSGRSPKNLLHLKNIASYFEVSIDELVFGHFGSPSLNETETTDLVPFGTFDVFMKRVK